MLNRDDCLYQPYFCEENIWQLCHKFEDPKNCKVVFISNEQNAFVMKQQIVKDHKPMLMEEESFIIWDYHAVLMRLEKQQWLVYDLNTKLPFPFLLIDYCQHSFIQLPEKAFMPCFRVIDAPLYLKIFSSDRHHMLNDDGQWTKPPPAWDLINPHRQHNLHKFIDFNDDNFYSPILNFNQFIKAYT